MSERCQFEQTILIGLALFLSGPLYHHQPFKAQWPLWVPPV